MKRLRYALHLSRDRIALVGVLVFLFSASWFSVGHAQITAYPVTVLKSGGGAGTVTSVGLVPTEIDCGLTCSGLGPQGGSVTLTALPDAGSTFIGWVGSGCSGTGPCNFTLEQPNVVVAMFGRSGANSFSATDLAGTWYLIEKADHPTDNGPFWSAMTVTVDATGTVTGGNATNSFGGQFTVTGGTLLIDGDGLVAGGAVSDGGGMFFPAGKLDPAKSTLGLTVTEGQGDVGLMIGIKGGGTFVTSDLAGTWYFIETADHPTENGPFWSAATVTVDATGTVTGGNATNSFGGSFTVTGGTLTLDPATGLVAGSATATDGVESGTMTFDHGKLDVSKTFLGLTVTESGGDVGLMIGIKGGGTFVTSDLAGTWYFIETADHPTENGPFWSAATVTVDATGTVTGGNATNSFGGSFTVTGGTLTLDPATGLVAGSATATDGVESGTMTFDHGKLDVSKTFLGLTVTESGGDVGLMIGIKGSPILPSAATLVSPTGTIATTTPTYTWDAVATAASYYLWVNDSGTSGKIQQWVTATEAGCAAGTGTCSATPSIALAQGAATWYVQTWNSSGYGPWSSGMGFTVPAGQTPLPATLIAPTGSDIGATPIYTWNAVPGATWYELWVNDSGQARKIDTWYTAAGVGCPAGTGTCVVAPSTPLAPGTATWWIQWWGPSGYGTWSQGMPFTVSQPSTMATLVSPSGPIGTSTPTYTWTAVPGMTWYFLWVEDTTGTKVQTWMAASTAGCGSGTGPCSYTPSTAISLGPATWWIQVWSPAGYGPWSDGMSFAVGP